MDHAANHDALTPEPPQRKPRAWGAALLVAIGLYLWQERSARRA